VEAQGWRVEVVDLDGRRIDKLLATPARAVVAPVARRPGSGPPGA
jgi:putative hemolysin